MPTDTTPQGTVTENVTFTEYSDADAGCSHIYTEVVRPENQQYVKMKSPTMSRVISSIMQQRATEQEPVSDRVSPPIYAVLEKRQKPSAE